NRLVFRLALEGEAYATAYRRFKDAGAPDEDARAQAEAAAATAAADPLGLLTTPDGWRFFLLRHMEFVDLRGREPKPDGAAPINVTALMDDTTRLIGAEYFTDLIVPDNFSTDTEISKRYADARNLCFDALRSVVTAWTSLATAIDEARV